ncbi:MAG: hypothetical protein WBI82_06315 [Sphaerochaeta sp.]
MEACLCALGKGAVECEDMPHSEIIAVMEVLDKIRHSWGGELSVFE